MDAEGVRGYKGEEKTFEIDNEGNVSLRGEGSAAETIAAEAGWISDKVTIGAGGPPRLDRLEGRRHRRSLCPLAQSCFQLNGSYKDTTGQLTLTEDKDSIIFVPG